MKFFQFFSEKKKGKKNEKQTITRHRNLRGLPLRATSIKLQQNFSILEKQYKRHCTVSEVKAQIQKQLYKDFQLSQNIKTGPEIFSRGCCPLGKNPVALLSLYRIGYKPNST